MTPITEDYDAIRKRRDILKAWNSRDCVRRAGGVPSECWCWAAGPDGSHLLCPEPAPLASADFDF